MGLRDWADGDCEAAGEVGVLEEGRGGEDVG